MIGYYAAQRERTAWSTATDIAMVAALLAAPLLVWACSELVTDREIRQQVFGRLMTDLNGRLRAQVLSEEQRGSPWPRNTNPIAEFELRAYVQDRGWPVTTSRVVQPPAMTIRRFPDAEANEPVRFAEDDPELREIAAALRARQQLDQSLNNIAQRWQQGEPQRSTHILGWIFGIALWWVFLFITLMLLIGIVRLTVFIFTAKKQVRGVRYRAEGKCAHCGYDLRGLEFNERCPECGHLSW